MTYTYAKLEVSMRAYDEIVGLLRTAGYDHAFYDGVIDTPNTSLEQQMVWCRTHACFVGAG